MAAIMRFCSMYILNLCLFYSAALLNSCCRIELFWINCRNLSRGILSSSAVWLVHTAVVMCFEPKMTSSSAINDFSHNVNSCHRSIFSDSFSFISDGLSSMSCAFNFTLIEAGLKSSSKSYWVVAFFITRLDIKKLPFKIMYIKFAGSPSLNKTCFCCRSFFIFSIESQNLLRTRWVWSLIRFISLSRFISFLRSFVSLFRFTLLKVSWEITKK